MQGTPEYCLVPGFIASPRQRRLFEGDWVNVLKRYQVSEFHATDFFGRNPEGIRRSESRTDCHIGRAYRICAGRIATYKRIREVEFINEIPKTPVGKLLRRVLKEKERAKQD